MQLGAPRAAEVADLGVVDAQSVIDQLDELRDQKAEVGITLPVTVGRKVHRHPFDPRLEVRAVVEVEAAYEVLICLTLAGMLRDDHAGNRLEDLARPRERARAKIPRTHPPLG